MIEGQIAWALSAMGRRSSRTTHSRGNFDQYQIRMADYPQIIIQFNNKWIAGVGEEACPQIAPAMAQAILKITGKRIRSLPFGRQDLSWA